MFRTYRFAKKNKFGNKKADYNGGMYHSKRERDFAIELDWKKIAKEIKSWERQVKISLDVDGQHVTNYFIDFVVTHNDGSTEYIEVKGFETPEWRLKWRLFEILYSKLPNTTLTVVR